MTKLFCMYVCLQLYTFNVYTGDATTWWFQWSKTRYSRYSMHTLLELSNGFVDIILWITSKSLYAYNYSRFVDSLWLHIKPSKFERLHFKLYHLLKMKNIDKIYTDITTMRKMCLFYTCGIQRNSNELMIRWSIQLSKKYIYLC